MIEIELLTMVINNLKKNFPELEIEVENIEKDKIYDAKLKITFTVEFEVKANQYPYISTNNTYGYKLERQKRTYTINLITLAQKNLSLKVLKEPMLEYFINDKRKNCQNIMIINEYVTSPIMEYLKEKNIFFSDAAGNTFINLMGLYIFKYDRLLNKQSISQKTQNIFYSSGLKLIYSILCNPDLINDRYNKIAQASTNSSGSVYLIINNLVREGYVLIKDKEKILIDKEKLYRKWIDGYAKNLRPKITLGKFRFKNFKDYKNWKSISLPSETFWSGEAASELCEEYLRAEKLILYTNKNIYDLIENLELIEDNDGYLEIFQSFWNFKFIKTDGKMIQYENKNIVSAYLRYADLIISENERNMEAAKIIYEKYISHMLK